MSKKFKLQKLVCPLLAFLLILTPASPAFAEKADNSEQTTEAAQADTTALPRNPSVSGWPSAPEIADETGVLLEASTGQVLFDKDMNEIRYPASTTKAMTALLILENISNINKKITFTDIILPDLAPGNSTINAQVGEELTVEQCLYAIMLASANEVCTQMAVEVAGSVSAFTDMMNQRAAELGCKNTHFVNANGLPDPNHYTTAYDLALILSEAIKNENFCKIAGAAKYTIPATNKTSTPRNLENHNALLTEGEYHYEGALAGKTGHTEAARNTLITAAKREDMTLVCVVMRSEGDERFTDTRKLFDYGFDNFARQPVYWLNSSESGTPDGYAVLPKGASTGAMLITEEDTESARVRTYSYQGKEILQLSAEFPLQIETRTTSDMSMFQTQTVKKSFVSPLLLPGMVIVFTGLSAMLMWIIVKDVREKKERKRRKKGKKN